MSLAIYIHIPYCIQKCRFCDFTTFTVEQMPPPELYVNWLKTEINNRHEGIKDKNLRSIYFGGGTPSLLPVHLLVDLINHLNQLFHFHPNIEISIEINPGTITKQKLKSYLAAGVNRFSVGVQTFRDDILKLFHREHSAKQTKQTLALLKENNVIFSTDILFALNHQSLKDLITDLNIVLSYQPHHISTYYMTLSSTHILQKNRPIESVQIKMFQLIESTLAEHHFIKYEISNFAKPGFLSKHNMTYWRDRPYWGIGLSSHSFLKIDSNRIRFWNPKNLKVYSQQIQKKSAPFPFSCIPHNQKEFLKTHEALTDYCHTALRTRWGIQQEQLKTRFGEKALNSTLKKLSFLKEKGQIKKEGRRWIIEPQWHSLSNEIFREMTF